MKTSAPSQKLSFSSVTGFLLFGIFITGVSREKETQRQTEAVLIGMSKELTEEQKELFDRLTKLQQRVCIGVLEGKSQRQAYYDAGGKATSDESADATVSEILSNPMVKAFVDSVLQSRVNSAIMTREEALERLSLMARTEEQASEIRGAIKLLCDMEGWEAPKKISIPEGVIFNMSFGRGQDD